MLTLDSVASKDFNPGVEGLQFESVAQMLEHIAAKSLRGTLILSPNGTRLHLRGNRLEAVENFEPLGRILLRQGHITEDILARMLALSGPLGEDLMAEKLVGERDLRRALVTQARLGLSYALRVPPDKCEWLEPEPLPLLGAGLEITPALLEALFSEEVLPLEQPFRLAPQTQNLTLDAQEWSLLRCFNGRRSLLSAMRMSGLEAGQAESKAHSLFRRGLLQASSISGTKLIVLARKPLSSSYHPPSAILSNLFLKAVRHDRSVWEIAELLKVNPEAACAIAAELYRSHLLEVVRGKREMEFLLDEF